VSQRQPTCSLRMDIVQEIFEIRSLVDNLANDIKQTDSDRQKVRQVVDVVRYTPVSQSPQQRSTYYTQTLEQDVI